MKLIFLLWDKEKEEKTRQRERKINRERETHRRETERAILWGEISMCATRVKTDRLFYPHWLIMELLWVPSPMQAHFYPSPVTHTHRPLCVVSGVKRLCMYSVPPHTQMATSAFHTHTQKDREQKVFCSFMKLWFARESVSTVAAGSRRLWNLNYIGRVSQIC